MKELASLAIQNAPTEDSDQNVRMCRLIWIFHGGHMTEDTVPDTVANFTLNIVTPELLTLYVLKFEQAYFTTCPCV